MNRKELIDMIENGTSLVRSFLTEGDSSLYLPSSYENWNNGDVAGHIIGWMNYSIDKLSCLKLGTKQSDVYSHVSSLDDINKLLYNTMKGKSREEIETDYIDSIGSYIKVVSLFSNSEINADSFDTGFKMELWRYMLLDTVIHPVQHILYQYLKNDEYGTLIEVLKSSKALFEKYSEGKKAFQLAEFELDRSEYQNKLNKLEIEYGSDFDVKDFVEMNRVVIAQE